MKRKQSAWLVCWVLVLVSLGALTGCDGRVIMAGHVMSLLVSIGMVWSTLNLTRKKRNAG